MLRLRLEDSDTAATLKECCENHVSAMIATPEVQAGIPVRFAYLGRDTITFDLVSSTDASFKASTMCAVTSFLGKSVCSFLTTVRKHSQGEGDQPSQLILDLPSNMAVIDLRGAVRIPIVKDSGLEVQMVLDEYSTETPTALDLSQTGMLVEFPADRCPDLSEGDLVRVGIALHESTAEYMVEVRHRTGGKYGLMFTDADAGIDMFEQGELLEEILDVIKRKAGSRLL